MPVNPLSIDAAMRRPMNDPLARQARLKKRTQSRATTVDNPPAPAFAALEGKGNGVPEVP